jgi:hypothetical protein
MTENEARMGICERRNAQTDLAEARLKAIYHALIMRHAPHERRAVILL